MSRSLLKVMGVGILLVGICVSSGDSRHPVPLVNVPGEQLSLIFVGDTSFGENYQEESERSGGENILKTRGYNYSLKNFAPFLRKADLVVANLETSVTDLPSSPLAGKKSYLHRSDLSKTPKALKEHNISVVSLANNHTLDYGTTGLQQFLKALKKHDIQWFGAGLDEASAVQPLRLSYLLAGQILRFVIAGGFEYRENYDEAYNFYADGDKGGTNAWTVDRAFKQVRAMRLANPNAFVVTYPHFGKNYAWKTKEQTRLAHALIDAGANLVIGHGAHLFQEIEQYRERWIIYNLGNFVFNSPGRYQKKKMNPFSLVARLDAAGKKDGMTFSLRLYPIFSDNLITKFQPHFVTDEQFLRVQKLLLRHSSSKEHLQDKMGTGEDKYGRYLILNVTPNKSMPCDNLGTQSENKGSNLD